MILKEEERHLILDRVNEFLEGKEIPIRVDNSFIPLKINTERTISFESKEFKSIPTFWIKPYLSFWIYFERKQKNLDVNIDIGCIFANVLSYVNGQGSFSPYNAQIKKEVKIGFNIGKINIKIR